MTPEQKRLDSYLRRQYGITLDERSAIVEMEGGKCPACGRRFDEHTRMEVDHEHFKIEVVQTFLEGTVTKSGWIARPIFKHTVSLWLWAKTKAAAIKLAKQSGRRASVRGILCGGRYAGCNRKLGRLDSVEWLENSRNYIADPPARKVLYSVKSSPERKTHEETSQPISDPVVESSTAECRAAVEK